jgi:thioredoxin 1
MITLTSENFEKETKKGIIIVDFWAEWCGPCRMVSPILEQLSEEMKNIKFGKVNVDEEVELAEKFEISSIPTLMIFKDGKVISTQVGAMSKERLKSWINEAIS